MQLGGGSVSVIREISHGSVYGRLRASSEVRSWALDVADQGR